MRPTDYLIEQAQEMGVPLTSLHAEQLIAYLDLIAKWNKVHNLTAVREIGKMLSLHILDSLSVKPYVLSENLLDVGSGAGLPGIPLAIVNSHQHVTVMDSNAKKTSFLRQVVIELKLKNITVVEGRIESLQAKQTYDGIISRAFSDINQFVNMSRQVLARQGQWYAMKGVHPGAALQQLPLGIKLLSIQPLNVPLLDAQRHLVILKEVNG